MLGGGNTAPPSAIWHSTGDSGLETRKGAYGVDEEAETPGTWVQVKVKQTRSLKGPSCKSYMVEVRGLRGLSKYSGPPVGRYTGSARGL